MTPNKYNLRWNTHHTETINAFSMLRSREAFVDVTLSCEGQLLKAHKLVLSAGSTLLERMLQKGATGDSSIIHFFGMKLSLLQMILDFIYNGEVDVPCEELSDFLGVAEKLEVKGLNRADPRKSRFPQLLSSGALNTAERSANRPLLKARLSSEESPVPEKRSRLVNSNSGTNVQDSFPRIGKSVSLIRVPNITATNATVASPTATTATITTPPSAGISTSNAFPVLNDQAASMSTPISSSTTSSVSGMKWNFN